MSSLGAGRPGAGATISRPAVPVGTGWRRGSRRTSEVGGGVSLERVRRAVAAPDEAGLRRTLRPRLRSEAPLDLAGNDYLGLAHDPRVTEAAANAARIWGAGSTGSRLVTGTTA